jgi:hypothetical protein
VGAKGLMQNDRDLLEVILVYMMFSVLSVYGSRTVAVCRTVPERRHFCPSNIRPCSRHSHKTILSSGCLEFQFGVCFDKIYGFINGKKFRLPVLL